LQIAKLWQAPAGHLKSAHGFFGPAIDTS